jgi:PAS domain S-box-containing protein
MREPAVAEFIDTIDGVFLGFDEDGGVAVWNAAALDVTGYDESALQALTFEELFDHDQPRSDAAPGDDGVFEGSLLTADGEAVPYEFEIRRLSGDGPVAFAGIGRDITARRERVVNRERVLREMYEIIADRDRTFEQQVESLLALGRAELGTAYGTLSRIEGEEYVFEAVHADDDSIEAGDVVPLSATNCEIAASNEQTLVLGDVARDAPEETDRAGYGEWGISCYIGAPVVVDDEVYGTFCFYDTTPRRGQFSDWEVTLVDLMSRWVSYELQRERTTERLEAQNERLERFASIVSHDLRNPLNVADGSLELARETGDEEHFERAADALDRMDTMIDDLLTLARAGEDIRETDPIDLGVFCWECWTTVSAAEATLSVETDVVVPADRMRLKQLLENLFKNAVEHGGEGVTVRVGDHPDGFYVADDGSGIPEADRGTVFDRGYSTSADGTGFGLDIVTEVADAHGWAISLLESEDGGARFEITGVGPV